MTRPDPVFWRGRRVLVTGHTGFKGGWLSLWLSALGARVAGFALAPPTEPNFFDLCRLAGRLDHRLGDVRNADAVQAAFDGFRPEIVFHLAAQSLVRPAHAAPVETFATNVMGTVHVLDAVRRIGGIGAVLIVTSDKCYAEREDGHPHEEADPLGGHEPYSASKAAAELVAASYARAFLGASGQPVATLRAGNVIGGGDWATDRLVADLMRGFLTGTVPSLRAPDAIRPWQHVLAPLEGYLLAAETLWRDRPSVPRAWNFGPDAGDEVPVAAVARRLRDLWGGTAEFRIDPRPGEPRETPILRLDSRRARSDLGWAPRWTLDEGLQATVDWFRAYRDGADMAGFSLGQIACHGERAP